jgi:hypothetical protein
VADTNLHAFVRIENTSLLWVWCKQKIPLFFFFFFFHLAEIVFGSISFKHPSMMMRMNSMAGGSWGVQVQRGLVDEVRDVERPGAGAFLSSSPKGAYTVTRSNNDGSTIFLWRRHMQRLVQSMMLLAEAMPSKFPEPPASISTLEHLIFPSLQVLGFFLNEILPLALAPISRPCCQEAKTLNLELRRI